MICIIRNKCVDYILIFTLLPATTCDTIIIVQLYVAMWRYLATTAAYRIYHKTRDQCTIYKEETNYDMQNYHIYICYCIDLCMCGGDNQSFLISDQHHSLQILSMEPKSESSSLSLLSSEEQLPTEKSSYSPPPRLWNLLSMLSRLSRLPLLLLILFLFLIILFLLLFWSCLLPAVPRRVCDEDDDTLLCDE